MNFIDKLLSILAAIGFFFTVVFYVLFKLKKDENKLMKEELENTSAALEEEKTINESLTNSINKYVGEMQKDEDLLQRAHAGDAAASLELMQNLSAKGKQRNKK